MSRLLPAHSSMFGVMEGLLDTIPWPPAQRRSIKPPRAMHKNELFGFRYPVLAVKPEWWWRTLACVPYLIALQISDISSYPSLNTTMSSERSRDYLSDSL
ncbi:hypothetical protein OIU76_025517 [Salix suchowensis]|nr:hypothetical protein OIU76_025517 [Salix suchowensis]